MCVFWEGKYRSKNGYTNQWVKNEFYELGSNAIVMLSLNW